MAMWKIVWKIRWKRCSAKSHSSQQNLEQFQMLHKTLKTVLAELAFDVFSLEHCVHNHCEYLTFHCWLVLILYSWLSLVLGISVITNCITDHSCLFFHVVFPTFWNYFHSLFSTTCGIPQFGVSTLSAKILHKIVKINFSLKRLFHLCPQDI